MLLLLQVPFLIGWLTTPRGSHFLFLSSANTADFHTYLAWIEQARQGAWLFQDLFTSEPQQSLFFHPVFLLLGRLSRLTHLSPLTWFHLLRMVCAVWLFFQLYRFVSLCFEDVESRRFAFFLALFGWGIGGYLAALGFIQPEHFQTDRVPIDIHIPEIFPLWSAYLSPLFSGSLALLLFIFEQVLHFLKAPKPKQLFLASLALLFLTFYHPYDLFILLPVVGLYGLTFWRERKLVSRSLTLLSALLISVLPFLFYSLYLFKQNPLFFQWLQSPRLTPPWWTLLAGFALLLPLFFGGIATALKQDALRLCLIWTATALFLAYFPVSFQRRLLAGVQIPIAMVATSTLFSLLQRFRDTARARRLFLIVASFSFIAVLTTDVKVFALHRFPYTYSESWSKALLWLRQHTSTQSVFLSAFPSGSFIAAYAGRKVYLGHQDQTLHLKKKEAEVTFFFTKANCSAQKAFLLRRGITYVFWGPPEKKLAQHLSCPFLSPLYRNRMVTIYGVSKPTL